MLSLRERMELDLKARLMGETLVLNRSSGPFLEDYIELNDLNEPFELRRNQGDDLMPTIEEGEIHIDCAHNLKFSCMIGFEFTYVNFFPLLYINVMSKKFHNSIMKDKMVDRGDNVTERRCYCCEPFLREVGIKARRFDGIITLYKSDDEVTYQMVRSHPRFKRHTNEQCNKIPPLLKVSEKDEKNGISHAYQKLKGFYKGVLNLGPDYILNAQAEESAHTRAT
ncbi:hypothetical protein Tco_0703119 [Tanacetum coccineum]|uniref:Transposase n=1 Tax=Tanacetum coccineum TaxID=301880 RepID=A0ABQ4XZT8_9ASTR